MEVILAKELPHEHYRERRSFASLQGSTQVGCTMPFTRLGLSPALLEGVRAMGYVEPTPIQLRTIPLILAGQDVIGSAQTGTGKTAAFALPILSQLGQKSKAS